MPRPVSSAWIRPLLAGLAGLMVAGCGGSDAGEPMDEVVGKGNAGQIRENYAALPEATAQGVESHRSARSTRDPAPLDPFAGQVSEAVNQARSQGRHCGDRWSPAAGPLQWNVRAAHAALLESEWMVANDTFAHAWPGGELVWDRLTMSGYAWEKADENIAAGYRSLAEVMRAWIESPPHCRALMRADVSDVAVAVVPGKDGGAYLSYWTMVLASPRQRLQSAEIRRGISRAR